MAAFAHDNVVSNNKPLSSERIKIGDISLNVMTLGRIDAQPIVFLHGFPEYGGAWLRVANRLADSYFCILPDLRGYNLSDKPVGDANYAIESLLADIDGLLTHFEARNYILAGHDWGGILAWIYAARHPDHIAKLIIANAPHPHLFQAALINDPAQRAASQYITVLRASGAAAQMLEGGAGQLWERLFAHNPAFCAQDRCEYMAAWEQPDAMNAMLAYYRVAPFIVPGVGDDAAMPKWVAQEAFKVDVPTLVFWGMMDSVLLPSQLEGLDKMVPNLTIERFDHAGHAVIHEQPEAIAKSIRRFAAL